MNFLVDMDPFATFAISLLATIVITLLVTVYRRGEEDRERQLAAVAVAYEKFNTALSKLEGDDPYLNENLQGFIDYLADAVHDDKFAKSYVDGFCESIKTGKKQKKKSALVSEIEELERIQPDVAKNIEVLARNASMILLFRWREPAKKARNVIIQAMLSQSDEMTFDMLKNAKSKSGNGNGNGAIGMPA